MRSSQRADTAEHSKRTCFSSSGKKPKQRDALIQAQGQAPPLPAPLPVNWKSIGKAFCKQDGSLLTGMQRGKDPRDCLQDLRGAHQLAPYDDLGRGSWRINSQLESKGSQVHLYRDESQLIWPSRYNFAPLGMALHKHIQT